MDAALHPHEVIDLVSDPEDNDFLEYLNDDYLGHAFPERGDLDDDGEPRPAVQPDRLNLHNWHRDFIDLTRPEHNAQLHPEPALAAHSPPPANPAQEAVMAVNVDLTTDELLTAAACLQTILEVLPDISVDHVLQVIADQTQDDTRTPEACQRIITQFLDGGAYPKEEEEVSRKRKRGRSLSEFEDDDGEDRTQEYKNDAVNLLKDEFLHVPVRHIEHVIKEHKTFFKAYGVIDEQLRNYSCLQQPFTKTGKARAKRGSEFILLGRGSQIPKELQAAKKKAEEAAIKRRKAEDAERLEENNLRKAILAGEMQDCQCCFDEFPLNRMTGCGGNTIHFFCKTCVKNYVESEMGSSRCRPVCFADSSCGGTFTRNQLRDCLGETSFDRLEHMQQMQDLEVAGLDLDECPFCDFKQECPPVEEDKEFRCLNPKCRKTSCRLCQKETHIPLSCEEAKKDEKLTVRHIVEEAMTAALIRNCNKCKHPFIKEYGCNKMTCSHCHNQQCYVCSKDIKDYNHFSDHNARREGCPLHDNIEDRHEQEVKKAADESMAKVKAENPGVSDADLMIQVSDRVKQTEQHRLGAAQAAHHGFAFHMAGGVLRNGPPPADALNAPAPAPPAPAVPVAPDAPAAAAAQQQQYVPGAPQFVPLPAFVPHQHFLVHQPQIFQHAHFNFALPPQQPYPAPAPFPQLPVDLVPAQVPQVGVAQLQAPQAPQQPQQAPHPQRQPRIFQPFEFLRRLAGQQADPTQQPRAQAQAQPEPQLGQHRRPAIEGIRPHALVLPYRRNAIPDEHVRRLHDVAQANLEHRQRDAAHSLAEQQRFRARLQNPREGARRPTHMG